MTDAIVRAGRSALLRELASYGETVILKNGRSVRLRALGPDDGEAIRAFFSGLSFAAKRFRFFAALKKLPESEVERLTEMDPDRTVALAAVEDRDGVERIVGIAEFARRRESHPAEPPVRAEYAVAVADDHQAQGIGTILLERIAATARETGVDELVAYVLADNAAMLDVFRRSGFLLQDSAGGGEHKIVFPTAETERFAAASHERERLAASESVRVFFEPTSVAVVGASRREGTIGNAIVKNLVEARFRGPIYPVNPGATEILGLRAYPSLAAVGATVDLVVIAVPAEGVEAIIPQCARAGARGVVVISSGFGETSGEGRAREARLKRLVRDSGMRLVGPNCMGVLNASHDVSLNATFSPVWPPEGNVSMLSQSGALGIAMLDYARQLNIGLSSFVSVGNKADVSSNDLLSYWADDPKTKVVVLYLESFGNARKFARIAPAVARKKPIVAVKSGRSAAGTRAAASHSAALASVDLGIDALFEQCGVLRTNTMEELFDVVSLLSTQPSLPGPRIGVVTNAGGPGILLADACEARGLTLPTLSPDTLGQLARLLPAQAGLSNPIDMIASATPEQYERVIELVGRDPCVDAVIAVYIPPLVSDPEKIAQSIAKGAGSVPPEKPVAAVFMSSKGAPPSLAGGPRGKLPVYAFPENAALALSASLRHARFRARPEGTTLTLSRDSERRIREIIEEALDAPEPGPFLPFEAVSTILELSGVRLAPSARAEPSPDLAARAAEPLGWPVVLKALAPGLVHKSDAGGVVLGLTTPEAVRSAASEMQDKIRAAGHVLEGFLVQKQVDGAIEAIVGMTTDPGLGPIVVAGLGGVQVELLGDAAFRLPPVTDVDAGEMLDSLKAKKLLAGFRGAPPGDRDALLDVIRRVSALVEVAPEIVEMDLNPVKVLAPGKGAVVVDARIRLARPD